MKQIYETLTGGKGGRKGRGQKWRRVKWIKPKRFSEMGRGEGGKRWLGLSYPLPMTKVPLNPWAQRKYLEPVSVEEESEKSKEISRVGVVDLQTMQGITRAKKTLPELNWSVRGWSGRTSEGRYVGVPEGVDGVPLTDFHSIILEMRRVRYKTSRGSSFAMHCFVVVGNMKGMIGFAEAQASNYLAVIRKAKNRAVKQLQQVPVCEGHTIYHNINSKCCKTRLYMERKVKGYGLRCNRKLQVVMQMIGIKDIRVKQIGPSNTPHLIGAAIRGLFAQQTYEKLAKESGKCVVQYRSELGGRPLVVAVPSGSNESFLNWLKEHNMLHPELEEKLFTNISV